MTDETIQKELKSLSELFKRLELRVARLEEYLEIGPAIEPKTEEAAAQVHTAETPEAPVSLEFRIGEYWLAHFGTVALLLGIAFILSYPFQSVPPILISLLGYSAVAGIFALSHFWRDSNQYLSKILFAGGLILIHFTTLRLHYFGENPLLTNVVLGRSAVLLVLVLITYLAAKRGQAVYCGIALFLFYATSMIMDAGHFSLGLICLTAGLTGYFAYRHNWWNVTITSMVLANLTLLLFLLNNPLMGNALQAASDSYGSIYYVILCGAIFGGAQVVSRRQPSAFSEVLDTTINSVGLLILSTLALQLFYKAQLGSFYLAVSALLLILASLSWHRHQTRYASALYASFGFAALSIAIFSRFQSPDYFVWLSWQSLIVVSSALWFRSRIIIVINFLIYLGIFLAYLGTAPSDNFVNLSYALVALASARILNWQQERLQLKTEAMRIAYLTSAFVIVLHGLYQAVPANLVSLSWLGAAIIYFLLSLILHRVKYRWMAIFTLFAVLIHVFLIDTARMAAEARILLFLAVGVVLLAVSVLYSKQRKRASQEQEKETGVS